MTDYRIGVLGGSGLYAMDALTVHEERHLDTPFGAPSGPYILGEIDGVPVVFLARHGKGHRLMPTELPFRANIFGFKMLGCERLISISAVGSLQEQYAPTHVVVPDQFFDRTRHRVDTFFGDGLVAHVALADPICGKLAAELAEAAEAAGATTHRGGTYLNMEGPQFSTRAESNVYRQWGMDIIGMTNLQEARLAREAEMCYATLAMVTDYDCWHDEEDDVNVHNVLEILRQNATMAQDVVRRVVAGSTVGEGIPHGCPDALAFALITDRSTVPTEIVERLRPIIGRYFDTDTGKS